jgi:Pyridoxamine 5'-phosphate oxidase
MISPSAAGRYDSDDRSERHFEALGRQQCLDLMESHHLGRVAWQAADLPQILPITYAMHEGSAYFRTAPDSILAELAQREFVSVAAWCHPRDHRSACARAAGPSGHTTRGAVGHSR